MKTYVKTDRGFFAIEDATHVRHYYTTDHSEVWELWCVGMTGSAAVTDPDEIALVEAYMRNARVAAKVRLGAYLAASQQTKE